MMIILDIESFQEFKIATIFYLHYFTGATQLYNDTQAIYGQVILCCPSVVNVLQPYHPQ